jgi:hypothetical protein
VVPALAVLLVLLLGTTRAVDLPSECAGSLIVNGGFEQPNTEQVPAEVREKHTNSKWGWYRSLPGWYTSRPDGQPCARVDWCGTCEHYGPGVRCGRRVCSV